MTLQKFARSIAMAAVVLCISGPAMAETAAEKTVTLLRQNGCVAANPGAFDQMISGILAEVGAEEMDRAIEGLRGTGSMWRETGIGLVLHPRYCGSNTHLRGRQPDAEKLREAIRANGCRMTGEDGTALLPSLQMTERDVGKIVESWNREGIATVDGDTLVLQKEGC